MFNYLAESFDSELIEIDDKKYKFNKNFRLYLMTKQTNPKITTSIYSNMTVINCAITQEVSQYNINIIKNCLRFTPILIICYT